MRLILLLLLCTFIPLKINAQIRHLTEKHGEITFRSSQNFYVKFDDVSGITEKDTLYKKIKDSLVAAVEIKFLSSRSAAGPKIGDIDLNVGDTLIAKIFIDSSLTKVENHSEQWKNNNILKTNSSLIKVENPSASGELSNTTDAVNENPFTTPIENIYKYKDRMEKFNGRFSVQSSSNISNSGINNNFQRWRYAFALNGENIFIENLSFISYITFSYRADEWSKLKSNFSQSIHIYDSAIKYSLDETSRVTIGRNINQKISNISSIDGLQFEKDWESFYTGLIAGSRPDFNNFGFNFKLFELGGYIGRIDSIGSGYMDNTLAAFQQTNNFKTDRRFLYFQHLNFILPKTFFFLSTEIDLFKKISERAMSTFGLTSLFLNANYSPTSWLSINAGYDARKNVIYYETFKTFIDSLLENETRQGYRIGLNVRPLNNFFIGLNAGYRFKTGDVKPSNNFAINLNYSNIPLIEATSSLSYTKLTSSYVDGNIFGLRLSKDLFNSNIFTSMGYNRYWYFFASTHQSQVQNIFSTDLSWRIFAQVHLSLSYEATFDQRNSFNRIFIDISSRF